jgi:hypothetical protein
MHPVPLVWSEEELRYLDPPPPRTALRSLANPIRRALFLPPHTPHETTRSSVIHSPSGSSHGNFIDVSYRRILANPVWACRLRKPHTARRQARASGPDEEIRAWCELDAATSSDALLMNIFCYPRVLATSRLPALMGVPLGLEPEFGYRPGITLGNGRRNKPLKDRSEMDMRLGPLLIEAKLTENDFQAAPLRLLERYPTFEEVFDREGLEMTERGVRSYQLIRSVLATHALPGTKFCVITDARRGDLIEAWYDVMRAVRSFELQARLRLVTWQEIAAVLPSPLRNFLAEKYGICAGTR